jgi:hypothetical protein
MLLARKARTLTCVDANDTFWTNGQEGTRWARQALGKPGRDL